MGDAPTPQHPGPPALPGQAAWLPAGGHHGGEGRATRRVTNRHVPSRAVAVQSSDRSGLWHEGAARARSWDGCDPAHKMCRQRRTTACSLPCQHPCLHAVCPSIQLCKAAKVGARALWYLQAPQDQHHSLSPGRDGDALLSAWGLWGCLHRGVRHKRRKAWQGAEVGTVSRSRWSRKKMHAVAHRCPHGLDGDFKGSCHPQGDPSQAGEAAVLPAPAPQISGHPQIRLGQTSPRVFVLTHKAPHGGRGSSWQQRWLQEGTQRTGDAAGHPLSPRLTWHPPPTPPKLSQENKQSDGLTCFLVRVFPVRSLMYRAISSLRPAGRAKGSAPGKRGGPGPSAPKGTSGPPARPAQPGPMMLVLNEAGP